MLCERVDIIITWILIPAKKGFSAGLDYKKLFSYTKFVKNIFAAYAIKTIPSQVVQLLS